MFVRISYIFFVRKQTLGSSICLKHLAKFQVYPFKILCQIGLYGFIKVSIWILFSLCLYNEVIELINVAIVLTM